MKKHRILLIFIGIFLFFILLNQKNDSKFRINAVFAQSNQSTGDYSTFSWTHPIDPRHILDYKLDVYNDQNNQEVISQDIEHTATSYTLSDSLWSSLPDQVRYRWTLCAINELDSSAPICSPTFTFVKGEQPISLIEPSPACSLGMRDRFGQCNPACCGNGTTCPNSQRCDIANGDCTAGFSCNPDSGDTEPIPIPTSIISTIAPSNAPSQINLTVVVNNSADSRYGVSHYGFALYKKNTLTSSEEFISDYLSRDASQNYYNQLLHLEQGPIYRLEPRAKDANNRDVADVVQKVTQCNGTLNAQNTDCTTNSSGNITMTITELPASATLTPTRAATPIPTSIPTAVNCTIQSAPAQVDGTNTFSVIVRAIVQTSNNGVGATFGFPPEPPLQDTSQNAYFRITSQRSLALIPGVNTITVVAQPKRAYSSTSVSFPLQISYEGGGGTCIPSPQIRLVTLPTPTATLTPTLAPVNRTIKVTHYIPSSVTDARSFKFQICSSSELGVYDTNCRDVYLGFNAGHTDDTFSVSVPQNLYITYKLWPALYSGTTLVDRYSDVLQFTANQDTNYNCQVITPIQPSQKYIRCQSQRLNISAALSIFAPYRAPAVAPTSSPSSLITYFDARTTSSMSSDTYYKLYLCPDSTSSRGEVSANCQNKLIRNYGGVDFITQEVTSLPAGQWQIFVSPDIYKNTGQKISSNVLSFTNYDNRVRTNMSTPAQGEPVCTNPANDCRVALPSAGQRYLGWTIRYNAAGNKQNSSNILHKLFNLLFK